MSGATGAPSAYALQLVPWVMYFDKSISLHGTYCRHSAPHLPQFRIFHHEGAQYRTSSLDQQFSEFSLVEIEVMEPVQTEIHPRYDK